MADTEREQEVVLVIHGGAGADITPGSLSREREEACRVGLANALRVGYGLLMAGMSALDAVQASVQTLEDDPLFNAGRGASLAASGRAELDAAIMDGASGKAGAIAGVTIAKNPVALARAVMDHSPHVFLIGDGAEEFARLRGLPLVENDYFRLPERIAQLERVLQNGAPLNTASLPETMTTPDKVGTVGAVARDTNGNLAAATSTGGMAGKRWGRVGDAPLIGAGTWADNQTCAVSTTGYGEYFIRVAAAHDVAARIAYGGASIGDASEQVIQHVLLPLGGDGGLIALDAQGRAALSFNTPGMYRGWVGADGAPHTAVFDYAP